MPIVKRRSNEEKLVYTTRGVLVVKTPAECTQWPHEFRLRLVTNYVAPRTLMGLAAYTQQFGGTGGQEKVYLVGRTKRKVMVRQPITQIKTNQVVVLRTEVIDVKKGRAMFLYHGDAAMRVLMTYAFLNNIDIPGIPDLDIYDYIP